MVPEVLLDLADEGSIISSETADKIDYKFTTDQIGADTLTAVLTLFDSEPSVFRHFSAELYYPDDRAANNLLSMSVNSLEASRYTQEAVDERRIAENIGDYYSTLAHRIDQGELEEISDDLIQFDSQEPGGVSITFGLDKEIIADEIVSRLHTEFEDSALTYWTSISQLTSWMGQTEINHISNKLFTVDHAPVLVTAHGENDLDGLIPRISLDNLDRLPEADLQLNNSKYRDRMNKASELNRGNNPPLAPDVFDTRFLREIFNKPFLFGFINSISEESTLRTNSISFLIASDKGTIDSNLSYPDWEGKEAEKTSLHEFYNEFKQRGSIPVYRDIWYKSIVEHCSGIHDLAKNKSDVIRYYQSLEEKAISGNFDELSGAVQDAQIFIGDVTNTLSTSTTNLTSEIQKLIFALFGVTAVNLFLILRKVGNDLYLPFTIAICAVLLLFYFPTSQERISELRKVINEGGEGCRSIPRSSSKSRWRGPN